MSKALESLERIKNIKLSHLGYDSDENLEGELEYTPVNVDEGSVEENYPEEIKILETALKALEIIKEKVGIHWEHILELWLKTKLIIQEEYDLLKEVLK